MMAKEWEVVEDHSNNDGGWEPVEAAKPKSNVRDIYEKHRKDAEELYYDDPQGVESWLIPMGRTFDKVGAGVKGGLLDYFQQYFGNPEKLDGTNKYLSMQGLDMPKKTGMVADFLDTQVNDLGAQQKAKDESYNKFTEDHPVKAIAGETLPWLTPMGKNAIPNATGKAVNNLWRSVGPRLQMSGNRHAQNAGKATQRAIEGIHGLYQKGNFPIHPTMESMKQVPGVAALVDKVSDTVGPAIKHLTPYTDEAADLYTRSKDIPWAGKAISGVEALLKGGAYAAPTAMHYDIDLDDAVKTGALTNLGIRAAGGAVRAPAKMLQEAEDYIVNSWGKKNNLVAFPGMRTGNVAQQQIDGALITNTGSSNVAKRHIDANNNQLMRIITKEVGDETPNINQNWIDKTKKAIGSKIQALQDKAQPKVTTYHVKRMNEMVAKYSDEVGDLDRIQIKRAQDIAGMKGKNPNADWYKTQKDKVRTALIKARDARDKNLTEYYQELDDILDDVAFGHMSHMDDGALLYQQALQQQGDDILKNQGQKAHDAYMAKIKADPEMSKAYFGEGADDIVSEWADLKRKYAITSDIEKAWKKTSNTSKNEGFVDPLYLSEATKRSSEQIKNAAEWSQIRHGQHRASLKASSIVGNVLRGEPRQALNNLVRSPMGIAGPIDEGLMWLYMSGGPANAGLIKYGSQLPQQAGKAASIITGSQSGDK